MTKRVFILAHAQARAGATQALKEAQDGYKVTIEPPGRTLDQNAAQWPYLEAWACNKEVCINGSMVKATRDDWKDVHTGIYKGETRMAVYDGRVIMLPQRTSKMNKSVFCDWMEYLIAVTAQAGLEPVYSGKAA